MYGEYEDVDYRKLYSQKKFSQYFVFSSIYINRG